MDEGLTICDCCGTEIPVREANDGAEFGYGALCNDCYAEALPSEGDEE